MNISVSFSMERSISRFFIAVLMLTVDAVSGLEVGREMVSKFLAMGDSSGGAAIFKSIAMLKHF